MSSLYVCWVSTSCSAIISSVILSVSVYMQVCVLGFTRHHTGPHQYYTLNHPVSIVLSLALQKADVGGAPVCFTALQQGQQGQAMKCCLLETSNPQLLDQDRKRTLPLSLTHTSLSNLSCCCLSNPARLTHRPIYSNEFVLKYLAAYPQADALKPLRACQVKVNIILKRVPNSLL